MIDLYLSTDGKHTIHVSAQTPEEMAELAPQAKALYQKVLSEFGSKAQMWESVIAGRGNGPARMGKRIDSVEQARTAVAPLCPVHKTAMAYRSGRRGPFWSCARRSPDGSWCNQTRKVIPSGQEQMAAA